ncbi:hypothetical protein TSUD_306440 [Trifolium subterraneum]|uniref:Uncharacterized protein n=1 Tax=Trifolium subterraneum TaxID=3900 RepID=A0A2Z6P051_TRISU|nr:hypothetical protein TSUD_306440 [Trifolium subterraneum]
MSGSPNPLSNFTFDLPVYMLFESSCGYLVFRAHDVYNVERNYVAIEDCMSSFCDEEALKYLTADGNGMFDKSSSC